MITKLQYVESERLYIEEGSRGEWEDKVGRQGREGQGSEYGKDSRSF